MKKGAILVTGAAGLLGGAVHERLAAMGREVIGIDLRGRDGERPVVECDLTDASRLLSIADGRDIAGIVHCGALSGPMVARDAPLSMVAVNIVGTANLLELARLRGVGRFVYCSSTSACGEVEGRDIAEDIPLHPTTVYGASKASGEHLVSAYAAQYGVDGVSIRFSWVYGPRRSTDCVLRTMILDAQAGRPTRLPFGRDFPRQYIHVDDASQALVNALDRPELPRRCYTVTGGSHMTLGAVADLVRKVFPQADIELADLPDPVDDRQGFFDIGAARRELGFSPQISLEQGIRSYAEWLRSNDAMGGGRSVESV